ncbi:Basic helix-loop-helix transcription factor [Parasponia andersonii]|uniref:Basic helix-loop-helix transcription factor n=1 Tax=Parasponia andersonii TaxID=3476 RepID=A0A2P5CKI0_PARAD|nr:Basic helix-loop-helix transcription factor [Parasponia andersonii]
MGGPEQLKKSRVIKVDSEESWGFLITQATNQDSPVVVHFTASWCMPSVSMNPFFEELALSYQDILFLLVDVDEVKVVASKMEIKAMPTFLLMKEGAIVDKLVGANPEEMRKRINDFSQTKLVEMVRSESRNASSTKACREKQRRDRLNDKFVELGSILEPGRPPKTDKAAILIDAVRMVNQLRGEAQKLKDSNLSLQEKIRELKVEKNELRDEKQRLKAEKEKLEQQLKGMNAQPGFLPPPPAIPAAFAAQGQAPGNKLVPFIGYPGVAMWQFMPPAAVDTSQDHVLRPPVA